MVKLIARASNNPHMLFCWALSLFCKQSKFKTKLRITETWKKKSEFPSLDNVWCRLMSSFTKTKGMKNQREKILSFFLIGKFKVSSTKPLFSRGTSIYHFMVLLLSKSFLLCEIFRLNNFPLWQMFWFICGQHFLWLVSFTCFATIRKDETPICGWTILLSPLGKFKT